MAQRVTTTTTKETTAAAPARTYYAQSVISNVIWFIAAVIAILLGFRFVLAALGANPGNGFANFIYTTSHPFVAPFFGLFNYNYHYGISRIEVYTLVALAVYLVAAWILTALINITRRV
jgi:hypothetical protein